MRRLAVGAQLPPPDLSTSVSRSFRNVPDVQVPTDLATEYYKQRASKGGLLITEATFIARGLCPFPSDSFCCVIDFDES